MIENLKEEQFQLIPAQQTSTKNGMYPSILTNFKLTSKMISPYQNTFSGFEKSLKQISKAKQPAPLMNTISLTPLPQNFGNEYNIQRDKQLTFTQYKHQQFDHKKMMLSPTASAGGVNLPSLPHKSANHSQGSILKAISVYMPQLFGAQQNKEEEIKEKSKKKKVIAVKSLKNMTNPIPNISTGSILLNHSIFKSYFMVKIFDIHGMKKKEIFITKKKKKKRRKKRFNQFCLTNVQMINHLFFNVQYLVEKGNNSSIVKRILSKREFWIEAPNPQASYNFRWKPTSHGIKYNDVIFSSTKRQIVNHIEHHQEISCKSKLYLNMRTVQKDIDQVMPRTVLVSLDSTESFERDLKSFVDLFFVTERSTPKLKNVWLIKPDDLNRGQGISVFNSLSQLYQLLQPFNKTESVKNVLGSFCTGTILENDNQQNNSSDSKPKTNQVGKTIVLQKYVETPLLIKERKFDIRAWVLVDNDFNFYLFKQGYLRLSSEPFSLKPHSLQDKFVHLTNNAIQKTGKNYGKFENGNIISYQDYEKFLIDKKIGFDLQDTIKQMKHLVALSFSSSRKKLFNKDRRNTFEIFGYDFLVQNNGKVFLIEANTNPCIEESNSLLARLIPRMLNDAFRLTIDKIFTSKKQPCCDLSEFTLDGYEDSDNLWEILGTLNSTTPVPQMKSSSQMNQQNTYEEGEEENNNTNDGNGEEDEKRTPIKKQEIQILDPATSDFKRDSQITMQENEHTEAGSSIHNNQINNNTSLNSKEEN